MAKQKTQHAYELELRAMIKARTGADFELWLAPQVRATAATMALIDKVMEELIESKSFVNTVDGSSGQKKNEVNPLMPYYLKLQAELRLQFEALGLNYRATPSKIKEDTRKGISDDDPMAEYLKGNNN